MAGNKYDLIDEEKISKEKAQNLQGILVIYLNIFLQRLEKVLKNYLELS